MEQVTDEWADLTRVCTWDEIIREYSDALKRVEAYCQAHPEARETGGPICLALGAVVAVHVGLRGAIADPSMHDELAPKELTEIVLALSRRVRRDVPELLVGQAS